MIVAFAGTSEAIAASAGITVTTSNGLSDPAAGVPRVFTLRGIADGPGRVYVSYRGPGGADCAPSASSDSGRSVGSFYGSSVSGGPFSFSEARTWNPPGPVVFCIWIARSESAIAVPIAQTMIFRPPVGTITALINPLTPAINEATAISVNGQSEAPARVYARIRAGGPCASSFDADTGRVLLSGDPVNGSFLLQTTTTQKDAGAYALCLWLALSGSDGTPIAATLQRLHVLGPPRALRRQPPCLVPGVTRRIRAATMKARIRAANCTVGKVRYLHSTRVPRRVVVRLSSRPGSKLQAGSPITIYVSTGRRPAVKAKPKR